MANLPTSRRSKPTKRCMLVLALAFLPFAVHAADLPTQLRIHHALRIAHQIITIDFAEKDGAVTAHVTTRHSDAAGIPQIDRTYAFKSEETLKLRQLFSALDLKKLRAPDDRGWAYTDGQEWMLSYGNDAGELESIKKRIVDDTDYVALFKFALNAVGFDPETTLPRPP